mgnify:CR=1 FL=1
MYSAMGVIHVNLHVATCLVVLRLLLGGELHEPEPDLFSRLDGLRSEQQKGLETR